jgi:ribosomal protein S6-L-glutamate ligase RimK-like protein
MRFSGNEIVLWGIPEDDPLALLHAELLRRDAPVRLLNQRMLLTTQAEIEFSPNPTGRVTSEELIIRVEQIRGLYLRPYDLRQLPELNGFEPHGTEWKHAAILEDLMWSWAEMAEGTVLNRPSAMLSNNSKPYQAELIREFGFLTPETILTTDSDFAREFQRRHGQVIYKSISGLRSIVSRLGREHDSRWNDLAWCPTQFQQWIAGVDYRVHVVGGELFACEIRSDSDDYRYGASQMRTCELPAEVAEKCLRMATGLRLPLCGIDLRKSADEAWFCFEVNPSPAFSVFEAQTGQPITSAIADLLIGS